MNTFDMTEATRRLEPALRYLATNTVSVSTAAAKFAPKGVPPAAFAKEIWAWLGQFNAGKPSLPEHRIDGVLRGQAPRPQAAKKPSTIVSEARVKRMQQLRGRERLSLPTPPPAQTVARLTGTDADVGRWLQGQGLAIERMGSFVVKVSPATAQAWLGFNQGNRKPSHAKIRRFAAAMKAGRWTLNGETVKFSVTGRLLDGQSRLQAIVMAGTAEELEVRGGLPDAAQESMDIGETRRGTHMLEMMGEKYPAILSPALKLIHRLENGSLGSKRIGSTHKVENRILENMDIKPLLERHGGLKASVGWCVSAGHKISGLMPVSEAAFWHYILGTVSAKKRDEFMSSLSTGLGLNATSPAYHLRERLQADRIASKHMGQRERFGLLIKAWNAHFAGEALRQLYFRVDGDNREPFPAVAGVRKPAKEDAA